MLDSAAHHVEPDPRRGQLPVVCCEEVGDELVVVLGWVVHDRHHEVGLERVEVGAGTMPCRQKILTLQPTQTRCSQA